MSNISEVFDLVEALTATVKVASSDDEPTEELETVEKPEEHSHAPQGPAPARVTAGNLFRHPDAHPLVLDLALLKKYGPDFLTWEAETLEIRIPQDFKVSEVSDLALTKIQACRAVHLVDTFWQQWEVFVWVTMALNGYYPDFETLQVPTVGQCAIAVDIVNRIRDDVEWSSEVKAFLAQIYRFEGIFCPQPPMEFVKLETNGLVVDCADVSARWPAVRASKKVPAGESIVNEQLRRLLHVEEVLEEHRALLRSQLPLVQHV